MKNISFIKAFSIFFSLTAIIAAIAVPILQKEVYEVVFDLNLAKNQEQAERLATLISIDLERGESSEVVLAKVQTMLENTPQNAEHFACIIAGENRVIAHPKPSNVNKDVTGWTIANDLETKTYTQSAAEGVTFGGIQTRLDGSQDITYQVPISTEPWSVCVHTDLDLVKLQTTMILNQVGKIVLPSLLLIVLIGSFFFSRRAKKQNVTA
ncbi:hypothetical protein WH96_18040 [Kiloniella spongiae]|uniref:Single cache domain-containing protein n=1 Tax=Kiloniella spongiae TaxID=1489064 RepID=A0A0H2MAR6_9PROT|nr:hypothetical protein [Kiloniella spongiae]KLN59398.1 hypothetical protein WH96_18040 [Kiloniella spongiae]